MRFFLKILSSVLALSWLASCSSDTTITDIPDYEEHDPLTFSVGTSSTSVSRAASHELEQGFMVSTYKLYGSKQQQKVMECYEALYSTDEANKYHGSKWNTVGKQGADNDPSSLYQTQYERYWDLSAFPYRFHAITPCPKQATVNALITDFELSDKELKIPAITATKYESQTADDGVVTPATVTDPYMIAQVERDANGVDWDLLQPQFEADGTLKATRTKISETTANFTRAVPLRFHHINSKVRFAIYTTVKNFPAEALTISNVKISAKIPSTLQRKFITYARGFNSQIEGNPFTETPLLFGDNFFDKGSYVNQNVADVALLINNSIKTADLKSATSREKAYFFDIPNTGADAMADGTPGGLLQIPQKGVELYVEFDINNEHYSFQLEVNGNTQFDWRASCRYTYYIVVKHLVPFEIAFTATIEPWVTVTSSNIDTDLEQ